MAHCLYCGYDRFGLTDGAPCPECGHPDDFAARRAECLALGAKPFRLLWRFLTFRRPPVGWWEVLVHSETAPSRVRHVALSLLCIGFMVSLAAILVRTGAPELRQTRHAFHYQSSDPARAPVQEISSGLYVFRLSPLPVWRNDSASNSPGTVPASNWLATSTTSRIELHGGAGSPEDRLDAIPVTLFFAIYTVFLWAVLRYVWLNTTLALNRNLLPEERRAARRAANYDLTIPAANLLASLFPGLIGFAVGMAVPHASLEVIGMAAGLSASAVLLLFAPLSWWRMLAADRSRRVFPKRWLAVLLLFVIALAPAVLIALPLLGVI